MASEGQPAVDARVAVVLLSGGLDSYTTAAIARQQGFGLHALTVRYGQRHAVEVEAARAVGRALHVARHVEIECMRFQEVASSYAEAHETRLIDGVCQPQASSAYLAILDSLREVARHSRQIAHRVAATRLAATPPS